MRYGMKCLDCKKQYPATIKDSYFNKKQVAAIKCPYCKSKSHIIMTSSGAAGFIGGTSKMDNFDYRAKVNMEKAKGERRAAEKLNGSSVSPYQDYYDRSNLDEGIHDNEDGIVL